jgi:aldehyde dehydrogenase (NAD+)
MVVMRAKDDADAVRICNSTRYGLGSSVFSTDYARAERIAAQLETGMVNVNDFGVNYLCQSLPFGGVKDSGFDRFAGVEGLRGCCLQRAITTDKVHGIRTNIPPLLQYPIPAAGFDFATSLVGMMYGPGLISRAKAIWKLTVLSIVGGGGAKKPKSA